MTTPQGMLELAERALEQAQDCINRETPEDMTVEDAREDTIAKIREALRGIAALRLSASPADEEIRHLRIENARLRDEAFLRTSPAGNGGRDTFQKRVLNWLMECFSMEVCRDGTERNHRFLEEALELVQSLKCTRSEAHQLVDYVFDRPAGEPMQELGGVQVTLAALCFAHDLNMDEAAERELARVWTKIDKIREKQAAKPKHLPLPALTPAAAPDGAREALADLLKFAEHQLDFASSLYPDLPSMVKRARAALALPAVVGIEGRIERALFDALNGLIIAYGATDGRNGNSGECWDKARAAIALARHPHQPVEDKPGTIQLDHEQAKQIFDALSIGYEHTCSICCPSVWKTGERPPHSDACQKVLSARSMLIDLGSYADMRASGGLEGAALRPGRQEGRS